MGSRLYQRQEEKKKKTPHSLSNIDSGMLQGRPFIMQLKTRSQEPDLKKSLSQAERYGHHLDKIQCALSTTAPIQMLSTDEEEEKKLTSGMDLETNKLTNNKKVLENVLSVASGLKTLNNQKDNIEQKKYFAERTESATETSKSKDKDKKQNSDEHLTSPTTNKISEKEATEESSPHDDPEVTRLLNKPTQTNLAGSGDAQHNNQEKFMPPPSTYNEDKNTGSKKVGSRTHYLAKREAMDMLGNNKGFASIQRAVNIPLTNNHKSETSKAEDSQQQVRLKDAAELVRDQVVNEDRQVKEHLRGTLNLDPAIVAKEGGEQLILQKMQ